MKKTTAKKPAARKSTGGSARRSGAKRKSGKRFRIKDPRKLLRLLPVITIPVLLVAMLLLVNKTKLRETFGSLATFVQPTAAGTTTPGEKGKAQIEDVALDGLSREEATAQIKSAAAMLLADIDMTIMENGEELLRLTASFIEATTNMDELIAKVYDEGASGSFPLTISANEAVLKERLESIRGEVGTPAVEPYADVRLNENNVQRFEFHDGRDGTALDIDATAEAILLRLAARDLQASLPPVMKPVSPAMSLSYVKENTERIATFTTSFRDSESVETIANRVYNITKAAEIINCAVVQPDEEWSFNGHVGLRTLEDGWKEAKGIYGGNQYTLQAGGGICQVSTTLYNALLRANVEVTDRKAHSIPSDYVDKGLDATVDSAGIDLKFRNNTGAPLYIFAYIKPDAANSRNSTITVSLYGKPLPDGVTYEMRSEITDVRERTDTRFTYSDKVPEGYEVTRVDRHDGYTAEVYRDKYINGKLEDSTLLYTDSYRGNVAQITIGTGKPGSVPVPEGAVKSGSTENEAG